MFLRPHKSAFSYAFLCGFFSLNRLMYDSSIMIYYFELLTANIQKWKTSFTRPQSNLNII
jgi:hypothetical protein